MATRTTDDLRTQLHAALSALVRPTLAGKAAPAPAVAELVQRIDQLRDEWGRAAPKMLRHYLHKRSYAKALDLLEGRDAAAAPRC